MGAGHVTLACRSREDTPGLWGHFRKSIEWVIEPQGTASVEGKTLAKCVLFWAIKRVAMGREERTGLGYGFWGAGLGWQRALGA